MVQGKTVVSFCTGGIRCEKAALVMREEGLDQVWQLEGGILKYFEETGGAHFHGTCFVFDLFIVWLTWREYGKQRLRLDPSVTAPTVVE